VTQARQDLVNDIVTLVGLESIISEQSFHAVDKGTLALPAARSRLLIL
jgi:hypothetical protein